MFYFSINISIIIFQGFANIFWFLANSSLGFSICFPIVSGAPGIFTALMGVFIFDEIKGKENYKNLIIAIGVQTTALAFVAASH